ncbi:MAG: helix-turn-helix domain-containing protein [Acidimicrobiales bacterium]
MAGEWLSTPEAARFLGIVPRTLYRLIDSGQLAAYRFGRVIRIKEEDLKGFVEASRLKPGDLAHLFPEPVSAGAVEEEEEEEAKASS